jgi:hypothetical protein
MRGNIRVKGRFAPRRAPTVSELVRDMMRELRPPQKFIHVPPLPPKPERVPSGNPAATIAGLPRGPGEDGRDGSRCQHSGGGIHPADAPRSGTRARDVRRPEGISLTPEELKAAWVAGYEPSGVDDWPVGRDPRRMTPDEIRAMGHEPLSPTAAIRAKCLDC